MASAKKRAQQKRQRFTAASIAVMLLLLVAGVYLSQAQIPVLQPAGPIAAGERRMLIIAFGLMLLIVIPVFVMVFGFAWRYRESNKATYTPNWDHSRTLETIWWLIPGSLIFVLAVMTWHGTFQYDPYQPIASKHKTMTIQVVALNWRWLFIYPQQQIATVNYVKFPADTPVNFEITSDAPMNSFWIPRLGGQIYAMPGMTTHLNLLADHDGQYRGVSANISGKGFAGMHFMATATSDTDFTQWVNDAHRQPPLTKTAYGQLSRASTDQSLQTYGATDSALFSGIVDKYMTYSAMSHSMGQIEMESTQ